jgi:signal peptidase I
MTTSFRDTTTGKIFDFIIGREKKKHSHGDPSREVFETIVFVVVLVLMLKLFVAEAFVIPTGSMASTLWGDQVVVTCPDCGEKFPVTASASQPPRRFPQVTICQNCGLEFAPSNPTDWNSGDRVLVGKFAYHIRGPHRFDVPVFKFPKEPYNAADKTAMNYIKRLIGLPGETIAIYRGDLYRTTSLKYEGRPRPDSPKDLWQYEYTYANDPEAEKLFYAGPNAPGGFEPIRKSPEEILMVRRLVFDLDRAPKSLSGVNKIRWNEDPAAPAGWSNEESTFKHTGTNLGWIRYHHVRPGSWTIDPQTRHASTPVQPAQITDFLSYNVTHGYQENDSTQAYYWVPDLIVDCTAEFAHPEDTVTLELNKANDKFQARFDNGTCRLFRIRSTAPDKPELMAEQKTNMRAGRYALRFANVDSRLTVWVDGRPLDFGGSADYEPPNRDGFDKTTADINEPARIGATGNVTITKLSIWRDVYYTCYRGRDCGVQTFYVQPGHYFCLGDNSSSSSDGRDWGLVPERLMLGKAVVVYWPLSRIGVIK